MLGFKYWLSLIVVLSVYLAVQGEKIPPSWFKCVGVDRTPECPRHSNRPCGPRDTVEKDIMHGLMNASVLGDYKRIKALLHEDVVLNLPTLNIALHGKEDVAIYLSSWGTYVEGNASASSRLPYYSINPGFSFFAFQNDRSVSAVANQTIPSVFLPGQETERPDEWWAEFNSLHQVVSLDIRTDTFIYGSQLSEDPVISKDNVHGEFPSDTSRYIPCVGTTSCRVHPRYQRSCPYRPSSLYGVMAQYIVERIFVNPDSGTTYLNTSVLLYDPNVEEYIPYLGVALIGAEVVLSYGYVATITGDQFLVVSANESRYIIEGTTAVYKGNLLFDNIQDGSYHFSNRVWERFLFDSDTFLIQRLEEYPDAATTVANLEKTTVNVNATSLCIQIMSTCTGHLTQYNGSYDQCLTYVSSLPDGLGGSAGQYKKCISFHLNMAEAGFEDVHCPHCGDKKISPLLTPCQNFPMGTRIEPGMHHHMAAPVA